MRCILQAFLLMGFIACLTAGRTCIDPVLMRRITTAIGGSRGISSRTRLTFQAACNWLVTRRSMSPYLWKASNAGLMKLDGMWSHSTPYTTLLIKVSRQRGHKMSAVADWTSFGVSSSTSAEGIQSSQVSKGLSTEKGKEEKLRWFSCGLLYHTSSNR